jgi:signal-transduction protein with cAMP-binding, CBS, and nucleotidyltransferase domain
LEIAQIHGRFPVVLAGVLKGIAAPAEIAAATASGQPLKFEPAMTCRPGQSIRESQALLIQSTTGAIVVTDESNKLLGIVTLHDLLRAQLGVAERDAK